METVGPPTESVEIVEPAGELGTYILLPVLDGLQTAYTAVFADGSFTRWLPTLF